MIFYLKHNSSSSNSSSIALTAGQLNFKLSGTNSEQFIAPNSVTISLISSPSEPVVDLYSANTKAGEATLIIKCSETGFAYFFMGIVFEGEDE